MSENNKEEKYVWSAMVNMIEYPGVEVPTEMLRWSDVSQKFFKKVGVIQDIKMFDRIK